MRPIDTLLDAVEREARRAPFPIDEEVYKRAGREPLRPILYAGSLAAPICVLGRDLGKDEVAAAQPLIGAGGRLVRAGLYRAEHGEPPPATDRTLESVLNRVVLTNTVPYKPPGNKAYSGPVKERFRPFLAELLVSHWKGDRVLTLGTEAFKWFAPYADDVGLFEAFWKTEERYEASIDCTVFSGAGSARVSRRLSIQPLPHPSPLNQRWYRHFPDLLARRLSA